MKKLALCLLLVFVSLSNCFAENKDDIISVKVIGFQAELRRGEENPISLEITIKEPYHINSPQPTDDFVIPTSISFNAEKGLEYSSLEFPEEEFKRFEFSENPMPVFEGTIRVTAVITIPASFQEGEVIISGTITYQACDDKSCLPPAELDFSQKFPVTGDVHAASSVEKKEPKPAASEIPQEGEFAQTVGEKGLFLTFILIFLGGLALDLTPCVYPIIPITIGYFGGQAHGRKGGVVAHAIMYVLGMAVTYSSLGVLAALTGSLFGAAMQNPFVLIGVAVVLIALALSMFDLYEFRFPSFLMNMAGGSKQGYFGTLFMGLTVGIVAAPCIGPFVLGLLTYVGEKGNVLLGFLMFFVLALGLGLPFLFLAIFSGSINKLPRSGAWMVWVRTIFGFILLAMAVYFLGPLFPNTLVYHMALALILLIGGIYMAWIEPTKLEAKAFLFVRNFIGILFFASALLFGTTGIQSYVDENLESAIMEAGSIAQLNRINWSVYSERKLQEAAAQAKPIFLDFHADWCIPCKEMDKTTFVNSQVVKKSRDFVMLKLDLTGSRNPLAKKLEKKFQIKGVPTYVFLKPDGKEIRELRTVGYIKAERLLEKMEKAKHISQDCGFEKKRYSRRIKRGEHESS